MLFKLSNLNSNLALTLGYLNPALNNSALGITAVPREIENKAYAKFGGREGRTRCIMGDEQVAYF